MAGGLRLLRAAAIVDGDVRAFGRESDGDRLPDARRRAGDQDILAFQFSHWLLLARLNPADGTNIPGGRGRSWAMRVWNKFDAFGHPGV